MSQQSEAVIVERTDFWKGALFGMLAGMGSLLAYQYFSGILSQPRLISKAILSDEEQFENQEALAMFIAAENLRSAVQTCLLTEGQSKEILNAGYRNFRESWARDFAFATYGLLALEQYDTVKDTLEAYLWHQTDDGKLPVKLHSIDMVTRFFHSFFEREQPVQKTLRPKYITGHGTTSLDGQALLVIAAQNYARQAKDVEFLRRHWSQLKLAMQWIQSYRKEPNDPLLYQFAYSDWADSIARRGRVLYTNVVYWKALASMAEAAASMDVNQQAEFYAGEAKRVSDAIQAQFWREDLGYYVTSASLSQLSSAGNLLAIAWDLATPTQAQRILNVMAEARMAEPVPTQVSYPPYPPSLVAIENRLSGMGNYHTHAAWLWIGAWHVIALIKAERIKEAQQTIHRITELIVKERQLNEAHGLDARPLSSLWYKSESPLTWNAGMVLYAYKIFESHPLVNKSVIPLLTEVPE
jgi:GH15 family glucan-1,4-alpha-glucosidase